jgi:ABC-type multidrug transport system ATPase subunit
VLDIRQVTKTYPGGVRALDNVSLTIERGVFGLLGPNGAGKTTLMKIAATLLDPDSGTVVMAGTDVVAAKSAARRLLGYLPQQFGFYPSLTAEQTLHYFARLKGIAERSERAAAVAALLERVNLSSVARQRVGEFSGGMQQRLGIAQALIGSPTLVIVDEPTAGLDPDERTRFHNLLAEVGTTAVVVLSTHVVADVAMVCSRMGILRNGHLAAWGSPAEEVATLQGHIWEATVPRETARTLRWSTVIWSRPFEGQVRMRVHSRVRPSDDFTAVPPTLDDFYFLRINATAEAA